MKENIIEIMKCVGYEFIEESPEGRLLFYETDMEQTIQLWLRNDDGDLKRAMLLITTRAYDRGVSVGRYNVQNEIKKALRLI